MNKVAMFQQDGREWNLTGIFTKDVSDVEARHLKSFGIQTRAFPLQDTVDILEQLTTIQESLNALPQHTS